MYVLVRAWVNKKSDMSVGDLGCDCGSGYRVLFFYKLYISNK